MSMFENIYLYTGDKDIKAVAEQIAAAIRGEVTHDRDQVVVARRLSADSDASVSGKVERNPFYESPPNPQHPEVMALYDISYDVWCPLSEEEQAREAASVFNDITDRLEWPALLTHNGDLLIAAWAPATGRTEFPPGTSSYAESQELWNPYADPAGIAHPAP